MAVGQRQRLYSGVRMFTGNYLSSTPRALRMRGVYLELKPLMYVCKYMHLYYSCKELTVRPLLNNARYSRLNTAALATIQVRRYTNYLIDENLVLAK